MAKHDFMCGWLDRQGKFYPCDEYAHMEVAKEIERNKGLFLPYNEEDGILHGERLLEKLGWIKFTQRRFYKELDDYPDDGYAFYLSLMPLSSGMRKYLLDNIDKFSPNQKSMINDIVDRR